ncbi:MAG: RnfH family protein [Wenzhouxiangella sp.]|nr:MAG: RnfH family protein [Wenzhouxiangella sp.]
MNEKALQVEVAAGLPDRQLVIPLILPSGATVQDALAAANLPGRMPGLEINPACIGVFGRLSALDRPLADGDRVEVYRPLKADPKEVRRQLAELERSSKKG